MTRIRRAAAVAVSVAHLAALLFVPGRLESMR